MTSTPIENEAPLQPDYLPVNIVDREKERKQLAPLVDPDQSCQQTLYLHGPSGTGKSHLAKLALADLPDTHQACYVPCTRFDTTYKALQQICTSITDDDVSDGYHTSDLQRMVEERVEAQRLTLVLDDVDFLLMNDGDDLLYYLSRMKHRDMVNIVMTSSTYSNIAAHLEERTYSGVHPYRVPFESYSADELYRVLAERARNAFAPKSVHTEALTYIAAATKNANLALTWLRLAAKAATDRITEQTVTSVKSSVRDAYATEQLEDFTVHHRVLWTAVNTLPEESETAVTSGDIYERYQQQIADYDVEPLSTRRVSDYLKHLEQLDLVEATYHYGGTRGKTRELRPIPFSEL